MTAAGAATSVVPFQPTSVSVGSVDSRLTLRRLIVNYLWFQATAFTGNDGGLWLGVYLASVGEPDRNPRLTAATDLTVDWLDLWPILIKRSTLNTGIGPDNLGMYSRNIRVMRKVDQDQQIRFASSPAWNLDTDAADATGSVTIRSITSALFSRTSR